MQQEYKYSFLSVIGNIVLFSLLFTMNFMLLIMGLVAMHSIIYGSSEKPNLVAAVALLLTIPLGIYLGGTLVHRFILLFHINRVGLIIGDDIISYRDKICRLKTVHWDTIQTIEVGSKIVHYNASITGSYYLKTLNIKLISGENLKISLNCLNRDTNVIKGMILNFQRRRREAATTDV